MSDYRVNLEVFAGPLVRSSYLADRIYYNMRAKGDDGF